MNAELAWIMDDSRMECVQGLNQVLGLMEPVVEAPGPDLPDPAFIIGAPRSGTTLLYQIMAWCLDIGYVNNFMARFWEAPAVGAHLSRKVLNLAAGMDGSSDLGRTASLQGVHEFGYFWRRFFTGDTDYADSIPQPAGQRLAAELRAMARALGKRLVIKNLTCGLRIRVLARMFPGARFIHVLRDPYSNGVDILRARLQFHGSEETWWSLEPRRLSQFKTLTAAEQVAAQLESTRLEIESGLQETGAAGLAVRYEDLCRDPGRAMRDLAQALDVDVVNAWTAPLQPEFAGEPQTPAEKALLDLVGPVSSKPSKENTP